MGDWRKTIRLPGERTARTEKRVSVNEVITEILEGFFAEKDRQRKGGKR